MQSCLDGAHTSGIPLFSVSVIPVITLDLNIPAYHTGRGFAKPSVARRPPYLVGGVEGFTSLATHRRFTPPLSGAAKFAAGCGVAPVRSFLSGAAFFTGFCALYPLGCCQVPARGQPRRSARGQPRNPVAPAPAHLLSSERHR